jgi:RNA polymerase sigma-70 factor (ECF subfamily)
MNLFQGVRRRTEQSTPDAIRGKQGLEKQERFERLIIPIWNQLARYCHTVAGDHETARDLMSETLLLAFQSFQQLREEKAFKGYLFRIAVRVNSEWRKSAARQTPLTDELALHLEMSTLRDDGNSALRSIESRELYEALSTLPEKQREAVVLFEISGLSLREIQEVQGGTLSGVKTRIARGREELARKLGVRSTKGKSMPVVTPPVQITSALSQRTPRSTTEKTVESIIAFSLKARL